MTTIRRAFRGRGLRFRSVVLAVTAVVVVTSVGVAAASARKPAATVHACANAKGVLKLLNANGSCPSGFDKVALDRRGPAGKTGPRGAAGPSGPGLARSLHKALVSGQSVEIALGTTTLKFSCDGTGGYGRADLTVKSSDHDRYGGTAVYNGLSTSGTTTALFSHDLEPGVYDSENPGVAIDAGGVGMLDVSFHIEDSTGAHPAGSVAAMITVHSSPSTTCGLAGTYTMGS